MMAVMRHTLALLLALVPGFCCFRFDYNYYQEAGGSLKFHVIPATWNEARLRCHAEGTVLASPLNDHLKEAIKSFVLTQKRSAPITIFSGVHATFSPGDYSSIEGVPLLKMPITWAPGEPDNHDNSERCLVTIINGTSTMADARCHDVKPYVCYRKHEPKYLITECGTTDPGYTLEPKTGSCYKIHNQGLIWSQAYMTCAAEGGYLAIINNAEEAEVVQEMFARHPQLDILFPRYKESLAVGLHDWGQYGTSFMTIHGESLDTIYNKWKDGEPNNGTSSVAGERGQYCGCLSNAKYDDCHCHVPLSFVCEKEPDSLLEEESINSDEPNYIPLA